MKLSVILAILKPVLESACLVYIDDVVVFPEDKEKFYNNLSNMPRSLKDSSRMGYNPLRERSAEELESEREKERKFWRERQL